MSRVIQTTNWAATPIYYATTIDDAIDYRDIQSLATALINHRHDGVNGGQTVTGVAARTILGTGIPSTEGELAWDSTNHTISFYSGTALRRVLTWDGTETMTNKSVGTAATDDVKFTFLLSSTGGGGNWGLKESVTTALDTSHRLAFKPANANSYIQIENTDGTAAFAVKAATTNDGSHGGFMINSVPTTDPGASAIGALNSVMWFDHNNGQLVHRMKKADSTSWQGAYAQTNAFLAGTQPISAPAADPTTAHISASQIIFFLDEGGGHLNARIKYADGTTTKTITTPIPIS